MKTLNEVLKASNTTIEEIKADICDNICKYRETWNEEKDGNLIQEKCMKCTVCHL